MNLKEQVLSKWDNQMGTPTTLKQAIDNAMDELLKQPFHLDVDQFTPIIQKHVRDFLAQKFQIELLKEEQGQSSIKALWKRVSNE